MENLIGIKCNNWDWSVANTHDRRLNVSVLLVGTSPTNYKNASNRYEIGILSIIWFWTWLSHLCHNEVVLSSLKRKIQKFSSKNLSHETHGHNYINLMISVHHWCCTFVNLSTGKIYRKTTPKNATNPICIEHIFTLRSFAPKICLQFKPWSRKSEITVQIYPFSHKTASSWLLIAIRRRSSSQM